MKRSIYSILMILFIASAAYSQIPNTISWQGIVQDGQGNNLSGNYSITVRLFEAASGGAAVWSEVHQTVNAEEGLVNLELGSVTPFNLTFNKAFWLEVQVGTSNPMPRLKLSSVPYALYSEKSSGAIINDSLVLKDSRGVTRMVLNPNTGTFKMMNDDTVWYEMSVNSPLEEQQVLKNGSYIRKRDNDIWEYDSENNLIYNKDVSDDEHMTIETYYANDQIHQARVTLQYENSKSVTNEYYVQEEGQVRIYSDVTTTFKQPTEVDGVENVVSKTANYNSISGGSAPAKTTQVIGKTVNGEFSEQYSDDGVKLNRKITSSVENKSITTEITYIGNNTATTNTIEFHDQNAPTRKEVNYYENEILKEVTKYYPNRDYETFYYNDDGSISHSGLFASDGRLLSARDGNYAGTNYSFSPDGIKFSRFYPTPGAPKGSLGYTPDNSGFQVGYQTYNGAERSNVVVGYNNVSVNTGSNTGVIQLNSNTTVTGNTTISGNLNVNGTKNFRISHPDDPENKYLVHAAIESDQVLNKYIGTVKTDNKGIAIVTLPDYVEKVNKNFHYQLTVIGEFAQAIVSKKISNNQFEIKTDKPNVEVSWEITGERNDKFMQEHPFEPVINKTNE